MAARGGVRMTETNPYLDYLVGACGPGVLQTEPDQPWAAYARRLVLAAAARAAVVPAHARAPGFQAGEHEVLLTAMVEQLVLSSPVSDDRWTARLEEAAGCISRLADGIARACARTVYVPRHQPGQGWPAELLMLVPNLVRLLAGLLRDPRVPPREKALFAVAAFYVLNPLDVVPDLVPVAGQADDLVILALVVRRLLNHCDPTVLADHWHGDVATLAAVENLLARLDRWLPAGLRRVLVGPARSPFQGRLDLRAQHEAGPGGTEAAAACWALGTAVTRRLAAYPTWTPLVPEVDRLLARYRDLLAPVRVEVDACVRRDDQPGLMALLDRLGGSPP